MSSEGEITITEDELALGFVDDHAECHRWVQRWHKWFRWDGRVWAEDSTLVVYDLVRRYMRNAAIGAGNSDELGRAKVVAAVETLSRSDRRVAAGIDQWDASAMLLNTPSGIVDLRTGELKEHDPAAYLTRITAVPFCASECPRWLSFLSDVTGADQELIAFLQRVVGYCLTGDTREHALFFAHGTGGNGKSTFINVVTKILGDYAKSAPMETFTASSGDRHPTELAMLRGARLVTATETEEGRRWAESKIKALTGGDVVTARFMRQDFFSFVPQFKLLIAGNHKPRLHAVDEAMRRRFHLIPFEVSFSGKSRVKDMEARLLEEGPAILKWAVDGCLAWQGEGLAPPARVKAATDAYFSNQDTFAEWLAECCETGPGYWETPTRLFNSWRAFAKEAAAPTGTKATFNDRMQAAGYQWNKDRARGRHWLGLKLKGLAEQQFSGWAEQG